ncbi:CLUMA_CG010101, isoform A [Clunio marinus]|uniref:CLUMA_CG010101, isoform A n=1 Tax=Clunio marinus TaxID=568069 RepID=A0A1J1IAI4_9DIPT|nr:CLUMA_CG010101, isoform A [Clunio marinus]
MTETREAEEHHVYNCRRAPARNNSSRAVREFNVISEFDLILKTLSNKVQFEIPFCIIELASQRNHYDYILEVELNRKNSVSIVCKDPVTSYQNIVAVAVVSIKDLVHI